ncbi:DNA-methyltransferase [Bacillus paralicheniformis]|uniref:DNA-methyltransferase n=1 Tax=Bacillus paralicheniformis TaxID=1648923 RepID=UPI0018A0A5CA|nr:site-specific DNA-methyltransferase [Bacillus paralicheniformis]MED1715666.1 site-specific DNA-methyltransferase [Bacillus paralicheniformis]WFF94652.1 site-specific DNA-methyltransferase [Bacillus paralicheniformis]
MADSILYNEDCIRSMKRLANGSIDLILTDPPYNLGNFMKGRDTNLKKMRDNFFGAAGWDDLSFEDWEKSMDSFFEESVRVLKKGGAMIVFMAIIKVESLIKIAERHGLYYKTTGIWHKLNPMPRNMNLHFVNSTEAWIYFTYKKKTGTFNNDGKVLHDFIETGVAANGERKFGKHPTQKPVQLMEFFIKVLTNDGETVLDPFMGSGSAGVAAKRNNRNFIGVEINEDYFQIATRRIQEVKE